MVKITSYMRPVKKEIVRDDETIDIYEWPKLEVKQSPNKGYGVFAKEALPIGVAIPYYGNVYNYNTASNYVVEVRKPTKLKKGMFIDAEPEEGDIYKNVGGNGLFIGGVINEPSKGEFPNCRIHIATRINQVDKWRVHVVTAIPIKQGDELLWHYGPEFERTYKVGHKHPQKLPQIAMSNEPKKRKRRPKARGKTANERRHDW